MIVQMGFLIICLPMYSLSDRPVSGWLWHTLVVSVLLIKHGKVRVSAKALREQDLQHFTVEAVRSQYQTETCILLA